jgi:hypothetical protein
MKKFIVCAFFICTSLAASEYEDAVTWAMSTINNYSAREMTDADVKYLASNSGKIYLIIANADYLLGMYESQSSESRFFHTAETFSKIKFDTNLLTDLFRPYTDLDMDAVSYFPEWGRMSRKVADIEYRKQDPSLPRSYNALADSKNPREANVSPDQLKKLLNSDFLENRVYMGYKGVALVLLRISEYNIPSGQDLVKFQELAALSGSLDKNAVTKTLDYYTFNSKNLTAKDIENLLDKDGLGKFIKAATEKELVQIGQLVEDLGQYNLGEEQFLEVGYYVNQLDGRKGADVASLEVLDAKAALADLRMSLLISQVTLPFQRRCLPLQRTWKQMAENFPHWPCRLLPEGKSWNS